MGIGRAVAAIGGGMLAGYGKGMGEDIRAAREAALDELRHRRQVALSDRQHGQSIERSGIEHGQRLTETTHRGTVEKDVATHRGGVDREVATHTSGLRREEQREQYDYADRNDGRSQARQAEREAAKDARKVTAPQGMNEDDKRLWDATRDRYTQKGAEGEPERTNTAEMAKKFINMGRTDLARLANLDVTVAFQKKNKPRAYPDAKWNEGEQAWVVQRNGQWYAVD